MTAPAPTARLRFEPLGERHAPELAGPLCDPALWRFIPRLPPTPADVARRFAIIAVVDRPNGERWLNWVVRRQVDGKPVGIVEVTAYPDRRAHLAYFVFTAFQRQGYGREACAGVLAHLRSACSIARVEASVDTRNEPSQRLLQSLGFTRDDAVHAADPIGGEPAFDHRYTLPLA